MAGLLLLLTAVLSQSARPPPEACSVRNGAEVVARAHKLLTGGYNAGSIYPNVWVRDLNTFLERSLAANDPAECALVLRGFLKRQHPDGEVPDGYIPGSAVRPPSQRFGPCLDAGVDSETCKNDAVSDQEASLVQAVGKYVGATSNVTFLLDRLPDGRTALEHLEAALLWVYRHRRDPRTGLVFGGTTLDWGDVRRRLLSSARGLRSTAALNPSASASASAPASASASASPSPFARP